MDVTMRCNWKCKTCFYRHKEWFNTPVDKSLAEAISETAEAQARGCNHVVLVGQGETSIWPHLEEFLKHCKDSGITSSIITNGTAPIGRYEIMYGAGLDHLHVSVHGIGKTLDTIAEVDGSGARQMKTLQWLKESKLPWRSNTTLQLANYKDLPQIAETVLDCGAFHVVFLGFLPHYEWGNRLAEVAVRSRELRPYLEPAVKIVADSGKLTTVRYHPMCHISRDFRKYVVNARYVLYDPWEWEYGYAGKTEEEIWDAAVNMFGGVGCHGEPCLRCTHFVHCGGFNQTFINGFNGNDLGAITEDINQTPGFLHDQNPANAKGGIA
jgi:MoaA/NifB/PqqE/SkfB family radical SAM enzyme